MSLVNFPSGLALKQGAGEKTKPTGLTKKGLEAIVFELFQFIPTAAQARDHVWGFGEKKK